MADGGMADFAVVVGGIAFLVWANGEINQGNKLAKEMTERGCEVTRKEMIVAKFLGDGEILPVCWKCEDEPETCR